MADEVGFAPGAFHFMQGAELGRIGFESGPHDFPGEVGVTLRILLKAGLKGLHPRVSLSGGKG